MSAESYPLSWPDNWPRTRHRKRARYGVGFVKVRDDLFNELRLMGARGVVFSTCIPLRLDGLPRAGVADKNIEDPGVACYFERKGKRHVIACDSWDRAKDNVRAVGLTVAAMRMIDRAGASELLDRAFTGFKALPSAERKWWDILGVPEDASMATIKLAYLRAAEINHPDKGGSTDQMAALNEAWRQAKQSISLESLSTTKGDS